MEIRKLILDATQAGYDTITITACGYGTLIKSCNSSKPGGLLGGGHILSAGGSVYIQALSQSYMDVLDSVSDADVRGLMAVGWLINVSIGEIRLFKNTAAGGRRHLYHKQVAAYRDRAKQVA